MTPGVGGKASTRLSPTKQFRFALLPPLLSVAHLPSDNPKVVYSRVQSPVIGRRYCVLYTRSNTDGMDESVMRQFSAYRELSLPLYVVHLPQTIAVLRANVFTDVQHYCFFFGAVMSYRPVARVVLDLLIGL